MKTASAVRTKDGQNSMATSGDSPMAPMFGGHAFIIEPGLDYRSDWTIISQMHGSVLRTFHVHFNDGKLIIYSGHIGPSSGAVISARYGGPLSRNVWHNIVFHLQEGGSDTVGSSFGAMERKLSISRVQLVLLEIKLIGNLEIYRGYGPIATPFAIQFASMKIGTSDLLQILKWRDSYRHQLLTRTAIRNSSY
jgi:hypothetical protein